VDTGKVLGTVTRSELDVDPGVRFVLGTCAGLDEDPGAGFDGAEDAGVDAGKKP
jgi:hypothetical protein